MNNLMGHLGNIIKEKEDTGGDKLRDSTTDLYSQDTIGGIAEGLNMYANNHVGLEQYQK